MRLLIVSVAAATLALAACKKENHESNQPADITGESTTQSQVKLAPAAEAPAAPATPAAADVTTPAAVVAPAPAAPASPAPAAPATSS
jgi:nitrous oxide reductase accessory protein NosL